MAKEKVQEVKNKTKENVRQKAPKQKVKEINLDEELSKLGRFGGYGLVETTVKGAQNLNPNRRARKNIFLSESSKKKERESLQRKLKVWFDLLSSTENLGEMIEKCEQQSESASQLLSKNLKIAVDEIKDLERSYRSVSMFFKNTREDKVKNLSIMNATPEQVRDLENTTFIDKVREELKDKYDRLDLRRNYSLLCVPGFLGGNHVVDKWARIAYDHRALLVTDFEHHDYPDDVMDDFERHDLTSADEYKSNIIMTCNWLVGRGKYEELGEIDDLYVPPSVALAGKMYQQTPKMAQVSAGKKFGSPR